MVLESSWANAGGMFAGNVIDNILNTAANAHKTSQRNRTAKSGASPPELPKE
jgi:hypothetical protein